MNEFYSPWAFALLALVPVAAILHLRPRRRPALLFSSVDAVRNLRPSVLHRLRHIPLLLRVIALILLIVAAARPRYGTERIIERSEGVAIEMVVDRSSSMGQEMRYEGRRVNRLEVVKKVFSEFVMGNDDNLKGRPSDLIGMIAFARYPDTVCPLVHSHDALMQFVDSTSLVKRNSSEDGTAIGDAIALAAARLKTAEEELIRRRLVTGDDSFKIKSKVIVLLTDGENNAGKRSPVAAAKLAAEWGIRIYCISIGGGRSDSLLNFFSRPGPAVNAGDLQRVAELTGGFYREATDGDSLRRIYEKIDKLETTEIASERYMDYRERFTPWAVAALCLLILEAVLCQTVFRRIP